MERYEVRLGQHFFHAAGSYREAKALPVEKFEVERHRLGDETVGKYHFHAQTYRRFCQLLADSSEAYHAERFAVQFLSFGVFFLQSREIGFAFQRHLAVRIIQRTCYAYHVSERQFGHRYRRCVRCVDNRAAYRARIRHVDIVHAYACASYQFEIPASVYQVFADFCSRAYHQGVYAVCIDVFSQTVLWNCLCYDFKTGVLKYFHTGFGHAVVGEYFFLLHNFSSFCIASISTAIFSLVIAL